jgi:hypothetical protein
LEFNNEQCLLRGPCEDVIRRTAGTRFQRVVRESVKRRLSTVSGVVEYSPDSNEMSMETEEYSLLEAVMKEQLVKTQNTEKLCVCCSDL